jgi:hypothetical protein
LIEIYPDNIFTDDALNIFTDASITTTASGETIGSAGALLVFGSIKEQIRTEEYFQIIRNTTNNDSEAKAIRLGVYQALRYRNNFKTIRLFSDSQINILGLKEWIFNWKVNPDNGLYYGSSGEVKNQNVLLEIVDTIVRNNLNIRLFHQKGHVKKSKSSLLNATHVFAASNGIRCNITYEFIKIISRFNNRVDEFTRDQFNNIDINNLNNFYEAIYFDPSYYYFDKNYYKDLITGGKRSYV